MKWTLSMWHLTPMMSNMDKDFTPDFLILPYKIVADKNCTLTDAVVYATVYWYEKLKEGKCFASNEELARVARFEPQSIRNGLNRLEKAGYIQRTYKDNTKFERVLIKCLYSYELGGNSQELGGATPTGHRESKSRESNSNTTPVKDNPNPVKATDNADLGIDLYRALYKHKLGNVPTWRSYGYVRKLFNELYEAYTPNQCLAIVFQHFEWRGTGGSDDWQLKKLQEAGFPITWLLNSAGMYADSLRLEVGGDIWDDDKALGKYVDTWTKQLDNS